MIKEYLHRTNGCFLPDLRHLASLAQRMAKHRAVPPAPARGPQNCVLESERPGLRTVFKRVVFKDGPVTFIDDVPRDVCHAL